MNIADFTKNVQTLTAIFAKKNEIGQVEQVYMYFDNTEALKIDVDWDTDEVIISFEDIQELDDIFMPILTQFYGMSIIRTWLMTNDMGYQDAIQFEFWKEKPEQPNFLQVQAIASRLAIYELKDI